MVNTNQKIDNLSDNVIKMLIAISHEQSKSNKFQIIIQKIYLNINKVKDIMFQLNKNYTTENKYEL